MKKVLLLIVAGLTIMSCNKHDEDFDRLNAQLAEVTTELNATIAATSQTIQEINSQVQQAENQVEAAAAALEGGLEELKIRLAIVLNDIQDLPTKEQVEKLEAALAQLGLTIDQLEEKLTEGLTLEDLLYLLSLDD